MIFFLYFFKRSFTDLVWCLIVKKMVLEIVNTIVVIEKSGDVSQFIILRKITQCLWKIWPSHIKSIMSISSLSCPLRSPSFFQSCCCSDRPLFSFLSFSFFPSFFLLPLPFFFLFISIFCWWAVYSRFLLHTAYNYPHKQLTAHYYVGES